LLPNYSGQPNHSGTLVRNLNPSTILDGPNTMFGR
jgi:hypothetical protein